MMKIVEAVLHRELGAAVEEVVLHRLARRRGVAFEDHAIAVLLNLLLAIAIAAFRGLVRGFHGAGAEQKKNRRREKPGPAPGVR